MRATGVRTASPPLETLKTRIDGIYRARCADLSISVLELPSVFRIGLLVGACGGTDEQIANSMRDACAVARAAA